MTYRICKQLISIKTFDEESKAELLNKIDIFLLNNRITEEEYNELIGLLHEK